MIEPEDQVGSQWTGVRSGQDLTGDLTKGDYRASGSGALLVVGTGLVDEPPDDLLQSTWLMTGAGGGSGCNNQLRHLQRPASSIPAFRKAGVGFTNQCLKQICSTGLFCQVGRTLTVQPLQVDGIRYFDDSPRKGQGCCDPLQTTPDDHHLFIKPARMGPCCLSFVFVRIRQHDGEATGPP